MEIKDLFGTTFKVTNKQNGNSRIIKIGRKKYQGKFTAEVLYTGYDDGNVKFLEFASVDGSFLSPWERTKYQAGVELGNFLNKIDAYIGSGSVAVEILGNARLPNRRCIG